MPTHPVDPFPSPDVSLVNLFHRLPYFDRLSRASLEALTRQAVRRTLAPGETIFLEGEPSAGLWVIEHGSIKIFKLSPEGREHIMHLLGTGESFNEIAAFDCKPNPANSAALSEAITWTLPCATLETALHADPALALGVIHFLTGRVRTLVGQIEDLALYSVTTRLARFLVTQSETPTTDGPGVTRAAIAAHLATTPETISRALRALEEAGAIRFDRHQIIIVKPDLLRTMALL
jgi:CRP/FNR family transcriptional regulator